MGVTGGAKSIAAQDELTFTIDCLDPISYPGTGATWTSTVNNTNIGTLNGDTNLIGKHMHFDGAGDFVEFVTTSNSITSDPFSIEIWWNPTTSGHDVMFANSTANGGGFYCKTQIERLYMYGTSSGYAYKTSPLWTVGQWWHMVITIDGTTVQLYQNAVDIGFEYNNGDPAFVVSTTNPFFIGNDSAGGGDFEGDIDIVRTYNRVLTASEVLQNYNATKGRFGL